MRDLK